MNYLCFDQQFIINMRTIILVLFTIHLVFSKNLTIHLHTHSWCPPCKKANTIFQRLQKSYPQIQFSLHKYTNKTYIFSNSTGRSLSFPTIIFQCLSHRFTYQNDLNFAELSYWIEVVCLNKIPRCNQKINDELYHILMEDTKNPSIKLTNQMLKHPHIKICTSQSSNRTSNEVIQILKQTDSKTLYFDYFSNNLRNYLLQSNKLAIAIITPQKNTSRVNSFMQSYASLQNFMSEQKFNHTQIYRYQLEEKYKQELVFLELCHNNNVSKCIYNANRKHQVHGNRKMIEKILHFFDVPVEINANFQQIIAFKFKFPHFQKHIYHNLGNLDQKFIFWINQILTNVQKSPKKPQQCYWNSITHRVSENNLQDIETHIRLSRLLTKISESKQKLQFKLNKIVKNYHSQPKFTICLQGKKPITYRSNKQINQVQQLISNQNTQQSEQL